MSKTAFRDLLDQAGKSDLTPLRDAALNAETPVHLLDEPITPVSRFFVRNNGQVPSFDDAQLKNWTLTLDGEVEHPLTLSLAELRSRFQIVTEEAVLECAGNGRHNYSPPTEGLQWGDGAVGCARWTGLRLADLLMAAGLKPSARYTAHFSADPCVDGDGPALSRGLPLWKALSPETLLAFEMNGQPLTLLHGAPLRIVAPGFPGSAWQKWIHRITLRDREHDGAKMTGYDYRLPSRPLRPGEVPPASEMAVMEDMPVKSLIVSPASGGSLQAGRPTEITGFAWSGHVPLAGLELSMDAGRSWRPVPLRPPASRFAWVPFSLSWTPGDTGETTILSRARDARGGIQPVDDAPWNPKGYANNRCHRVTVMVAA
ncbi:sulfite oxidase [Roseomonas xinghualingensis]|uniref:sulfite oxidase n=1 Tax=Roseomonas xinghualingensis TaxID=2986475 RepID=UPI0021F0A842|nr:sulfite oxidase [Roseomonas sp. SXEYE001]MCV4209264.1 sulfite oxidase [Roseomonas sp. SXEYE001]